VVDAAVGEAMVAELRQRLEESTTFEVAGQRVDFYGWCPNCASRRDFKARTSEL
jgi:Fe2+ or Zn2+ uptake regulation protein